MGSLPQLQTTPQLVSTSKFAGLPLVPKFPTTRRRITRLFFPVPLDYLNTVPKSLRAALVALWERHCRGDLRVSHEDLASDLGRSTATAARNVYELRNLGHLSYKPVKVSRCRNIPNLYMFPHLEGFIVEAETSAHKVITFADQNLKN